MCISAEQYQVPMKNSVSGYPNWGPAAHIQLGSVFIFSSKTSWEDGERMGWICSCRIRADKALNPHLFSKYK